MMIRKADISDLDSCTNILYATKVGQTYYPTRKRLQNNLKKGIQEEEIWVATAHQEIPGGGGNS